MKKFDKRKYYGDRKKSVDSGMKPDQMNKSASG
jgi:hypothetical protein